MHDGSGMSTLGAEERLCFTSGKLPMLRQVKRRGVADSGEGPYPS